MNRNMKPHIVTATVATPHLLFVVGWLLAAMIALTIAAQAG
jgi:hypothetical protein